MSKYRVIVIDEIGVATDEVETDLEPVEYCANLEAGLEAPSELEPYHWVQRPGCNGLQTIVNQDSMLWLFINNGEDQ